ncbi:MAG TPA: ATP synthase F0 subunit B [Terriglobia bacterium]|nr:ATP synthase F0 subunit B [Terriglobia bacterium]
MTRMLRVMVLGLCLSGIGFVAAAPCFAAAPPAAQGAAANQETGSDHELIFDIVNFILLVGVLVYLYRNRGRAFYNERSETIRKSLDEGRQALEASRAQLAAAEGKLAHFEDEVAALNKRAESEIARERERTRQATAEEVRKIQEAAKAHIQAATNAAKLEIKTYVVEQALSQAGSLIRERLDEESRRRMVSFFLADLKSRMSNN